MSSSRRGFFARLAALVAAPIVGKTEAQLTALGWPPATIDAVKNGYDWASCRTDPEREMRCTLVFKSTECGYLGTADSCDKTFADCKNRNAFLGFPQ